MTKDEEIRMINEKLDFYVMEASDEEFDTEEVRKLVKRLDELDPQHRGQPAHKQEEPRQVAADALVGDLHRHRAVDHPVIHGHLLLPERDAVAVADGQNRVRRVAIQPIIFSSASSSFPCA